MLVFRLYVIIIVIIIIASDIVKAYRENWYGRTQMKWKAT